MAAFRYGHSQVRERYQLRNGVRTRLLDATRRSNGGSPAFQPVGREHLVDWRFFFPITRDLPRGFNRARRIDPDIAPFLHDLGRSRVVDRNDVVSLPARNLSRGKTFRLPSGQAIAARVLPALYNRGLVTGTNISRSSRSRGNGPAWSSFILRPDQRTRSFIRNGQTPLWYYIVQEADRFGGPSGFGAIPTVTARSRQRELYSIRFGIGSTCRQRRSFTSASTPIRCSSDRWPHVRTGRRDARGRSSDGPVRTLSHQNRKGIEFSALASHLDPRQPFGAIEFNRYAPRQSWIFWALSDAQSSY